ncbi:NADP-dependent oxidoreductase [Hoyosella rhizosphaerae]|uniref:NADPH:quinone reductase n=1 Tax=Hoyosella rhizosphaerae TaxID=1755582 RepID=A0A916UDD0_9ACTN|nr:NADP-dependent oxidoreductase [Hoyosella rhizosphaerae]MBN4925754.1 NADP-dependent oxidoreductase [Hoyosella rhizosphaerae]GGC68218.1 NADPH:quinone reductase [Hoyosella rhizosphaerae]
MKAVYFKKYGGPEVLQCGERPEPKVGRHDVLIEVHAAAVNPRDWLLREGRYFARHLIRSRPIIPGSDVSGTVLAIGSDVTKFQPGDAVFGMQSILGNMGGYAERIAINEECLARKPSSVSHIGAAAIPVAGLTAWQALYDLAKITSGARVAIIGASGGVGHYAVQFARHTGAHITAVCSGKNADFVRDLGAHSVVDYTTDDIHAEITGVDVVFDTIGRESLSTCAHMMNPGGIYITTVPNLSNAREWVQSAVSAQINERRNVATTRGAIVLVKPRGDQLAEIIELMDAGMVRSSVDGLYPLCDAAEAHRQSRTFRTRGKIVLQVK